VSPLAARLAAITAMAALGGSCRGGAPPEQAASSPQPSASVEPPAPADAPSAATAEGIGGVALVASDETAVYLFSGGRLTSLAKDGGRPPLVLAAGEGDVLGMAVDGTHVYWTREREDKLAVGLLRRVAKTGGAPETVATLSNVYAEIAVDGLAVYLLRYLCPGPVHYHPGGRRHECDVISVPKGGGSPTTLLRSDELEDLALGPATVTVVSAVYPNDSPPPKDGGEVLTVPKVGGPAVKGIVGVAGLADVGSLAIGGGAHFWQDTTTMRILRLDAGAKAPASIAPANRAYRMAADAGAVCWIELPAMGERAYLLRCVSSRGGAVRVVARPVLDIDLLAGRRRPTLVVDGGRVYWPHAGRVWWASTEASPPGTHVLGAR
jgi:hypothetical protein